MENKAFNFHRVLGKCVVKQVLNFGRHNHLICLGCGEFKGFESVVHAFYVIMIIDKYF